jgi:4-alpha-glucanotransferase
MNPGDGETAEITTRGDARMSAARSAGILLHPTSLPGPHGIGELGPEALRFVEFLEAAGQRLWQVLPPGPTGPGGSPYSSGSAFAGNPLLISTDRLMRDGLLPDDTPRLPEGPADFRTVSPRKAKLLREAFGRAKPDRKAREFEEEHQGWLEDWALYAALKDRFGGASWTSWSPELARREPVALGRASRDLAAEMEFHRFVQHRFFQDWLKIREAANGAGIEVLGDMPIFVAHDSADVWANRELFRLEESGEPSVVAGVPPDYFSATGQRWGNPLYDWERIKESGYGWWISRMRMALTLFDAVRVDHFRGFEAYWEIPADDPATEGRWVKGPGRSLFETLRKALGGLPVIAEDLGDITPEVHALREEVGLPGMKVIQFGFSDPSNPYLPHNYRGEDWVVYTGTHDNDTTAGWWTGADRATKSFARRYLGKRRPTTWDFIRLAYASTAERAIVPMQDVLDLGSESRMNTPGVPEGNWSWRMSDAALSPELAAKLRGMAQTYGR